MVGNGWFFFFRRQYLLRVPLTLNGTRPGLKRPPEECRRCHKNQINSSLKTLWTRSALFPVKVHTSFSTSSYANKNEFRKSKRGTCSIVGAFSEANYVSTLSNHHRGQRVWIIQAFACARKQHRCHKFCNHKWFWSFREIDKPVRHDLTGSNGLPMIFGISPFARLVDNQFGRNHSGNRKPNADE